MRELFIGYFKNVLFFFLVLYEISKVHLYDSLIVFVCVVIGLARLCGKRPVSVGVCAHLGRSCPQSAGRWSGPPGSSSPQTRSAAQQSSFRRFRPSLWPESRRARHREPPPARGQIEARSFWVTKANVQKPCVKPHPAAGIRNSGISTVKCKANT